MTIIPKHHSALINGVQLHWMSLGKKSDLPPVLMLHGLNDCALTWMNVGEQLAKDREVFIPDLPGHGQSDRPNASYELMWYAEVMAAWMNYLDLSNVDLIGHSFGGGVAQTMLLYCRSRVRRLVLVASGGLGKEVNFGLRLASLPFLIENLGQPLMRLGTQIALRLSRDGRSLDHIKVLSQINSQSGSARAFSRTIRDVIGIRGQRRAYHERVHEIADLPPILLMWGAKDPIIPASHAEGFAKTIDCARVIILDDCGHYPHYQQNERFMKYLRRYLLEKRPEASGRPYRLKSVASR